MIRSSTRHRSKRLAVSAVEFAFVAPVFFLILLGILEYARFLFTVQLMNNAAREGARYAVVNTTTETTAGVQTYVDQFMAGQGAKQLASYSPTTNIAVFKADATTGANTGVSWVNAGWGDFIGVTVSGTYQPITPGLLKLSGTISLQATCVMTTEAN